MRIQSGLNHLFTSTLPATIKNARGVMKEEQLGLIQFFLRCLRQTIPGAYAVFIKAEIDQLMRKKQITTIQKTTSHKVAILSAGYYMSPSVHLRLKAALESRGIRVVICNVRYANTEGIKRHYNQLHAIIREQQTNEKTVLLFGYSSGGIMVHKVGAEHTIPTISFGAPESSKTSLVGNLLEIFAGTVPKEFSIHTLGTNFREIFSAMAPRPDGKPENTTILRNIYSHIMIADPGLVKILAGAIQEKLDSIHQ